MKRFAWVAVAGLLASSPATGQEGVRDGCDPEVQAVLLNAASTGVERDLTVIRHQEEGIGDPDSLFDMECDIFNFPDFDALVSLPTLGDLLDALKRRACAAAKNAWRRNVERRFDRTIYDIDVDIDRLPGLGSTVTPIRSSVGTGQGEDVFRRAIGGGTGQ